MPILSEALANAFQAHLGTTDAPFKIGGKPYPVAITDLTEVQIVALCRYGCIRAPNDKYNSDNAKSRNSGKGSINPAPYFADWLANLGTKQSGTRQRASKLDYRANGWIAYFKEIKLKIDNKAVSSKTLEQALEKYVRLAILKTATSEAQRQEFDEAMDQLMEDYQDQILEEAESIIEKGYPGFFIQEAKQKEAKEKTNIQPETKIAITIKPKG